MSSSYTPPSCRLYDHLEASSMRRSAAVVIYKDENGHENALETTIADLFSKDGADWARLENGLVIRLDRLVSVDGIPSHPAC